jgi:hypothetical protein
MGLTSASSQGPSLAHSQQVETEEDAMPFVGVDWGETYHNLCSRRTRTAASWRPDVGWPAWGAGTRWWPPMLWT